LTLFQVALFGLPQMSQILSLIPNWPERPVLMVRPSQTAETQMNRLRVSPLQRFQLQASLLQFSVPARDDQNPSRAASALRAWILPQMSGIQSRRLSSASAAELVAMMPILMQTLAEREASFQTSQSRQPGQNRCHLVPVAAASSPVRTLAKMPQSHHSPEERLKLERQKPNENPPVRKADRSVRIHYQEQNQSLHHEMKFEQVSIPNRMLEMKHQNLNLIWVVSTQLDQMQQILKLILNSLERQVSIAQLNQMVQTQIHRPLVSLL
jgi:hypothetical protein